MFACLVFMQLDWYDSVLSNSLSSPACITPCSSHSVVRRTCFQADAHDTLLDSIFSSV